MTAGDDNDDVGAVHRRRELGRHELERRKPLGQAFDVEPAALAHPCDTRLIAIVQAKAIAEQPQVGHERDAAEAGADDRHGGRVRRLVHAALCPFRSSCMRSRST
jgi:hypothetical protein